MVQAFLFYRIKVRQFWKNLPIKMHLLVHNIYMIIFCLLEKNDLYRVVQVWI